jgi:hypothetical protein
MKSFNLDDPKGETPLQVGEVEMAMMLFKLGFFADRVAMKEAESAILRPAAISELEIGPATMTLNMTPTGTAKTAPMTLEQLVVNTSYGKEHPELLVYESLRMVTSGRMESLDFARLMMDPANRALFRSQLKEAMTKFRSSQGYSPSDGVAGHITDFDCASVLSFTQPV